VTFVADQGGTRVDLEHRNFADYGERAAEIRNSVDSPGGWTGILASFAKRAASSV